MIPRRTFLQLLGLAPALPIAARLVIPAATGRALTVTPLSSPPPFRPGDQWVHQCDIPDWEDLRPRLHMKMDANGEICGMGYR